MIISLTFSSSPYSFTTIVIDHQYVKIIGQNAFKNMYINAPYYDAIGSPIYEFGNLKDEIEYQCPVAKKY